MTQNNIRNAEIDTRCVMQMLDFPVETYLLSYHPDGDESRGQIMVTTEIADAMVFDSWDDALAFRRRPSSAVPLRHDGKPNCPLMAFTAGNAPIRVPPRFGTKRGGTRPRAAKGVLGRLVLRDEQWERISACFERGRDAKGSDNRMFVEALLWRARTGSPWHAMPDAFGNWNSVFRRFSRWRAKGALQRIFAVMSDDPELNDTVASFWAA